MYGKCEKSIACGGEGDRTVVWHRQTSWNHSWTSLFIFNFQGASPKCADQKRLWTPLDRPSTNHSNDAVEALLFDQAEIFLHGSKARPYLQSNWNMSLRYSSGSGATSTELSLSYPKQLQGNTKILKSALFPLSHHFVYTLFYSHFCLKEFELLCFLRF